MPHESDGHTVKSKVALLVQCRGELGHRYRIDLAKGPQGCPECGEKEYDIRREIYEGDEEADQS